MPLDSSTSITLFGIEVWDDEVDEDWNVLGGSIATRRMTCLWGYRKDLVNAMIRSATQIGAITVYNEAAKYPDAPHLVCEKIHVEGLGTKSVAASGLVAYQWARLTLTYQEPTFDPEETGSEMLDFSSEAVAL